MEGRKHHVTLATKLRLQKQGWGEQVEWVLCSVGLKLL